MKANEFITEYIDPKFVNSEIKKTDWQKVGAGATASVWHHLEDPNTVVKVIGGGRDRITKQFRNTAIAFVHFCVDHGHESPHFPIIHGINIDDEDIVQIRIERLVELPNLAVNRRLESVAETVDYYSVTRARDEIEVLDEAIAKYPILQNNSGIEIAKAVKLLSKYVESYTRKHKTVAGLDLHYGNWLMRPNGIIVAADPWY